MQHPVESFLAQRPDHHVWVLEYGISHGRRMVLALHHGAYPRRTDVLATGCSYFRGKLEGGPYRLALVELSRDPLGGKRAPIEYRLFDQDGQFELICDDLTVGPVW